MSDLQCPANIVLARHGETEYDARTWSDAGGSLTLLGRKQSRELGESLTDRRVAMIYASGMARAVQTAEIAAGVLGVTVKVRDDLREFSVGAHAGRPLEDDVLRPVALQWLGGDLDARIDGGESGQEVVDRVAAELDAIADLHRGETVLVVSHLGALSLAAAHLATNLPADFPDGRALDHTATVELSADADGWVCVSWAGAAPR